MPELSPQLSAETWTPLYRFALEEYRRQFTAALKSAFQGGRFVSQVPFRDHAAEIEATKDLQPDLLAITLLDFDKEIEPIKQRAQQMLRRYAEITADAEQTP